MMFEYGLNVENNENTEQCVTHFQWKNRNKHLNLKFIVTFDLLLLRKHTPPTSNTEEGKKMIF